MSTGHGMSADAFASYNRAHGIGGGLLALALAALPMLTNGRIGPSGSCAAPAAAVAPAVVPEAPAPAVVATPDSAAVAAPVAAPADIPPAAKLYFETSITAVRAGSDTVVANVVAYLKSHEGAKAVITGFHDPRGSQAVNNELAKNRARSVAALLNQLGIAEDRLVMEKPAETTGTGTLDEARRVEVSVRP